MLRNPIERVSMGESSAVIEKVVNKLCYGSKDFVGFLELFLSFCFWASGFLENGRIVEIGVRLYIILGDSESSGSRRKTQFNE